MKAREITVVDLHNVLDFLAEKCGAEVVDELVENIDNSDISYGCNADTLMSQSQLLELMPEEVPFDTRVELAKGLPYGALISLGH